MAELVGGAILNAFINVLFERIATPEFIDLLVTQNVDRKLLQKLETYLTTINVVLYDAEYRQIALKDASVKPFLDRIKDTAYVADDLLDLIAYEVTATEIRAGKRSTTGNFPCNLSSLGKSNAQVSIPSGVIKKIEEIVEILEILVKQIEPLGLKKNGEDALPQREPTSPVVEESEIFGRRDAKDALFKSLKASDKNGIGVIPIVGMGGIGKTTLARLLYNDNDVKELFSTRAWVCVSDNYDGSKIKKELLQQVNISVKCDDLSSQQIDEELKKSLKDIKYLIVLDDVWKIAYANWDKLLDHLKSGADGSKIIVTTRIEDTSKMVRTDGEYRLTMLSDDSCWQLFKKHAFINGQGNQNVQSLREKVLSKCGGLPLAAKMLGGVMRGKRMEEWEEILKSEMWEIDCGVIPALMLSYQYLPSHLKQCFAYCAIFPQDYQIRKEELIQLWMAECFVVKPRGGRKSMVKLGEEYLQELVSRCFFQEHNDRDGSYFLMHDLISDLAVLISGDFLVRMDDEDNSCEFSARNRYFSFNMSTKNCSNILRSISKAQDLRTFWSFHRHRASMKESKKIVDEVFNVLLSLRVLSLSNFYMVKLPKSIKHLKHLRYLNLANTHVKRLPNSVCSLYNMQTLILYRCYELVELPKNIGNLINLHFLDIRLTQSLKKIPPGLGNLKDLRILGKFIVGKRKGANIDELGELQHLCGELEIRDLQNVAGISKDILKNKTHLEILRLMWTIRSDNEVVDSKQEERVLQRLQPYVSINELSIFGYGGKTFPDWIGDSSYVNIVSLELHGCKHCIFLPTFDKQSSLKHLSISNMRQCEKWCFCEENDGGNSGALMSLETLIIKNCPKLNFISPSGSTHMIFHSLNCLIVDECPNLKIFNLVSISNFKQEVTKPPNPSAISHMRRYDDSPSNGMILKILPSGMYSLNVEKLRTERIEEMSIALNGLETIIISECELCESIPLEVFTVLKSIYVEKCDNLKSLSASGESLVRPLTSLASLTISDCKSLICFPKGGISAPNMTYLEVNSCINLKSLPEGMNAHLSSLKDLKIVDCLELESFPEGGLPVNLQSLEMQGCYKLDCLPSTPALTSLNMRFFWDLKFMHCKDLQHLTHLRIVTCPDLQSFVREGLPSWPSDVETEIQSSQRECFLPNLQSLHMGTCDELIRRRQRWGLQRFDALLHLSLEDYEGDDLDFFPEESLLPSNLTSLKIWGFKKLKVINYRGLHHLASLSKLEIMSCSNLQRLPELQHLASLAELTIFRCSKLRCLPEEGLPSSLSVLSIWSCPLLAKRCEREKGEDWPKISHISKVDISK